MRATQAVHSGMPSPPLLFTSTLLRRFSRLRTSPNLPPSPPQTGSKYMGWWGDMGGPAQKGINSYVVSPFRQAPMRGAFKHWIVNGYKRAAHQAIYFAVPLGLGYGLLSWAIENNHLRNSKFGQAKGLFP
ncbi:hypothetical protein JCM10207_001686 [Rhodosporidiobolus poonsookiae]